MPTKKRKNKQQPITSRRQALRTIGLSAAGLVILGGSGLAARQLWSGSASDGDATVDFSERFAAFEPADEPNGDLSKVVWPPFVTRANPEVKRLYEFNIQNGELMRYMPCFCGCHLEDGHRNNRDCYVEAVNPDGTVVLDSMAPT